MPWMLADFLPTAVSLSGAAVPADLAIDGSSIVPTLLGKEQPELADRFLYWEFFEKGYQQASRWRDWKAVRLEQGEPLQLFDLAQVTGEENNVAAQNPHIVEKFETFLTSARTESTALVSTANVILASRLFSG